MNIREENGYCAVSFTPSEGAPLDLLEDVVSSIRSQSAITCANCGGHRDRPSRYPLCDCCMGEELRGSYLRRGEPADRQKLRAFRLEDAVRQNAVLRPRGRVDLSFIEDGIISRKMRKERP